MFLLLQKTRVYKNPNIDKQFLFAIKLTKQSYRSWFCIGNVMLFYLKLNVLILSIELRTLNNTLHAYWKVGGT